MHHVNIQAKLSRGIDLRRTGIDSDHLTSEIRKFLREYTVSAAQIQNALSGFGRQQFQEG
jgi:hypothetical protein